MKKTLLFCLLLLLVLPAGAATYRVEDVPNVQRIDSRRYVSNPDGILSAETVARLDALCALLRERGLAQVAVVAVDNIEGGDTFSFAVDLFDRWGVGGKKSNNGLGILLVRDLREIRFVTGGGVEGVLPDALCKRIQMRYMLPAFRNGDYDAGMLAGVEAAAQLLEGGDPDLETGEEELPGWFILFLVGGLSCCRSVWDCGVITPRAAARGAIAALFSSMPGRSCIRRPPSVRWSPPMSAGIAVRLCGVVRANRAATASAARAAV